MGSTRARMEQKMTFPGLEASLGRLPVAQGPALANAGKGAAVDSLKEDLCNAR